jgi:cell wall-associated NlpC family hydrolase
MGSRLAGHEEGAFLASEYGLVPTSHLRVLSDLESDAVAVAERQLGAPFAAGGRGGAGFDATGFIQLALGLSGVTAPRLPDQQRLLGAQVAPGEALRRGDLVFFEDGGGLMVDDLLLIHASQEAGKVIVEPLISIDVTMEYRRL